MVPFVSACVLGTTVALVACAVPVLRSVELSSVDKRFSIRGSTGQPEDVVLVAIDEATFSGFGNALQWPFPRRYHAKVIDRIAAGDPKAIAIDIQFTEPTNEAEDGALLEAVERAENVVLAAAAVDENGNTNVFGGPSGRAEPRGARRLLGVPDRFPRRHPAGYGVGRGTDDVLRGRSRGRRGKAGANGPRRLALD
jgi:CHASE2 domain-containing sensor protein